MASTGPAAPRYLSSPPGRGGGGTTASAAAAANARTAPPRPGALLRLLRRHGFADALPPSSEAWLDSHPVFRWLAANLSDANFVSPADAALCEALLLDASGDGGAADAALRRALEDQEEEGDHEAWDDDEGTKPAPKQQDALLRAMGLSPAGSSASSGRDSGNDDDNDNEGDSSGNHPQRKQKAIATTSTTSRSTAWLCGADDCPDVLEARVAARERAVAALEAQLSSLRACSAKLDASAAAAAAEVAAEAAAAVEEEGRVNDDQAHDEENHPSRPPSLLAARRRAVEAARRELECAAADADAELGRLRAVAREVAGLCGGQGPSGPARWLVAAADASTSGNNNSNSNAMAAYAREEARMRRRFERGIALLSGPTASVRRLEGDEGSDSQHDIGGTTTTAAAAAKTPAAAAAARGVLAARRLLADGARHRDQERRNAELRRELARQRVAFRCAIARQVAAREALARAEAQADAAAALAEHLEAAAGGSDGALSSSDPASVALLSAAAQAMVPALEAGNAARLEAEVASLELERARLLSDDDAASAAAAAAALAATAAAAAEGGEATTGNNSSPSAAAAAAAAATSLRALPIPALGEAVARLNDTHVLAGEYGRQLRKMEAAAARKGALVSALLAHGGRHLVLRSAQDAEARRLVAMQGLLEEAGMAARGMGERARARAGRYVAAGGLAAGGSGGGGGNGNGENDDPFARHAALLWEPSNLLSAVSSGAIDLRGLLEGRQQQAPALPLSASAASTLERAAREAAGALARARADAAERVGARLPELVADAHAVVSALFASVFPMDEAAEEAARRRAAASEGTAVASSSSSSAAVAAALNVRPRLTCPAVASTMDALAELNRELGAAVNDICKEHADRLAVLAGGGGEEEDGGASSAAAVAAARQLERRVWVLFFAAPDALAAAVDELRQRVQALQRAGM